MIPQFLKNIINGTPLDRAALEKKVAKEITDPVHYTMADREPGDNVATTQIVTRELDVRRMGPQVLHLCADIQEGRAEDFRQKLVGAGNLNLQSLRVEQGKSEHLMNIVAEFDLTPPVIEKDIAPDI